MPSAVRQKLSADLLRYDYKSSSSNSIVSSGQNLELQAHPGYCDVIPEKEFSKAAGKKSSKHHQGNSRKHSKHTRRLQRKSCAETLSEESADSDSSSSSCGMSSSHKSDSCLVSYHLRMEEAYALDSSMQAPHPSQLPMPPAEWLKPSKGLQQLVANGTLFQALFGGGKA